MKLILSTLVVLCLYAGCASNNTHVTLLDEDYVSAGKSAPVNIQLRKDEFQRPHQAIAIIQVELGRHATRADLNSALLKQARELGADGLQEVDYDTDRDAYLERHHHAVGRGRGRHQVVTTRKRVKVTKSASAVAVIFK